MKIRFCTGGEYYDYCISNSNETIMNIIQQFCINKNFKTQDYIYLFDGRSINKTDTYFSVGMHNRKINYIDVIPKTKNC